MSTNKKDREQDANDAILHMLNNLWVRQSKEFQRDFDDIDRRLQADFQRYFGHRQ